MRGANGFTTSSSSAAGSCCSEMSGPASVFSAGKGLSSAGSACSWIGSLSGIELPRVRAGLIWIPSSVLLGWAPSCASEFPQARSSVYRQPLRSLLESVSRRHGAGVLTGCVSRFSALAGTIRDGSPRARSRSCGGGLGVGNRIGHPIARGQLLHTGEAGAAPTFRRGRTNRRWLAGTAASTSSSRSSAATPGSGSLAVGSGVISGSLCSTSETRRGISRVGVALSSMVS